MIARTECPGFEVPVPVRVAAAGGVVVEVRTELKPRHAEAPTPLARFHRPRRRAVRLHLWRLETPGV